jgi:hypothetical protein
MEKNLNRLIGSLSKEEVRHFKLYSDKYVSNGEERKDLSLFDYIRKSGENYNEEKIVSDLYEGGKNNFYRLFNRLNTEINKSLLTLHYNETDLNGILYQVILSRIFQEKRDFRLALHYLRKAEKKAITLQAHELIELVYAEMLRLSNESLEVNPEEYIRKRNDNKQILHRLHEIDDILAVLTYRIKISQNFTRGNYEILDLLGKTIKEYSADKETRESPAFRMKVYHAVSRILLQQHDYISLEKYLLKTFKEFQTEKLFSKNNHDTKLQMLTYLANSLFKNNKHKESLRYADQLKESMGEFNNFMREKYLFYYYNILVNNYGSIDKPKAVQILLEANDNPLIRKNKFHQSFIYMQLALQYFDLKEFKLANKNLVRTKLEDNWKIFDSAFQLKILILELMIRYELKDSDFIEHQVPRIRKEYMDLLKERNYRRQSLMLDLLLRVVITQNIRTDKFISKIIKELLSSLEEDQSADNDLVNYNEWIRSLR